MSANGEGRDTAGGDPPASTGLACGSHPRQPMPPQQQLQQSDPSVQDSGKASELVFFLSPSFVAVEQSLLGNQISGKDSDALFKLNRETELGAEQQNGALHAHLVG